MEKDQQSTGVTIGNVSGGIQGSIIAGRDVKNATVTIGGQPVPADKEPTVPELKQLLAEIQRELADMSTEKEAFKALSPVTPFAVQGAEATVKDAAEKVERDMKPESARSVQKGLLEATSLLGGVLDGARVVAEKAGAVVSAGMPIAEKLGPLVDKVATAAWWVAKLWL